jgi:hypothetical protein
VQVGQDTITVIILWEVIQLLRFLLQLLLMVAGEVETMNLLHKRVGLGLEEHITILVLLEHLDKEQQGATGFFLELESMQPLAEEAEEQGKQVAMLFLLP